MRVLVVEDDENKRVQIKQFLRDTFPAADLELRRSVQSGLTRILAGSLDLVLLDMTLPNYDTGPDEPGDTPQIFGGREILQQMDRFDLSVPVIVVTQFETFGKPPKELPRLDAELQSEYPSFYCGSVYYHASLHEWKGQLKALIDSALARSKEV